tara:strand:- start:319 stop:1092 length:774 start_codon:yes stop_codon:yes gene_type:complete
MQTLNLSICGSDRTKATFDEVMAVETPQKTDTWTPISHGFLIEQTKKKLDESGFDIVDENHNLARFGQRYFGLMQVQDRSAPENPDRATVVGLRNGHDKCFPAGIMAGDAPFVCSNLIFNNEIVIARRHTKNIDNVNVAGNIFQKIANAIGQLRESWVGQEKRVEAYKEYDLSSTSEANDLIIRAFQNGACSKTQIADIVGQWNTPNHDEFKDRNLYSLYNSFSEVWKGNLGLLPNRSTQLHALFDSVAETPEVVEV